MNETTIREDVAIRGASYHQDAARDFALGSNRKTRLQWELNNEWDENAIQVIGTWTESDGVHREGAIGYVPKEIAEDIANTYGDAVPLHATIKEVQDPGFPVPKIYIDIMLS